MYLHLLFLERLYNVFVGIGSQIKTTFLEGHVPLGMGQEYKLHLTPFGLNIDRIIGETIGRAFHTQSSGNVSTIANGYL